MRTRHALLAALLMAACAESTTGPSPGAGRPATLEVVTGAGQRAAVGTPLPNAIRLRAVDAGGRPVAGAIVALVADPGNGTITPALDTADANGEVTASWLMPARVGPVQGRAAVGGVDPMLLAATADAGGVMHLVVRSGTAIGGDAGTALDTAVVVEARDGYGNPVPGATVSFQVGAGGGSVSPGSQVTDAEGTVVARWQASPVEGAHTLTVRSGGATTSVVAAMMPPVVHPRVVLGRSWGCHIRPNEEMLCWGANDRGQLGDGTTDTRSVPTSTTPAIRWRSVAVSRGATSTAAMCGVTTGHELQCWGDGTLAAAPVPTAVPGAPAAGKVVLGTSHACALAIDQRIWCWGSNSAGQLGDGSNTTRLVPALVAVDRRFRDVGAGNGFTCGLSTVGEVWCWGSNSSGQLGTGSGVSSAVPMRVASDLRFGELVAGQNQACARALAGDWFCWGLDAFGAVSMGRSGVGRTDIPVPAVTTPGFTRLATNYNSSCALDDGGRAWCWGFNGQRILGDPTLDGERQEPGLVATGLRFVEIATGDYATCGRTADGALHCWGFNLLSRVGVPDRSVQLDPVAVSGVPPLASIAVDENLSCGLTAAGAAWCWGLDRAPAQVPGGPFTMVDVGGGWPNTISTNLGPGACGLTPGGTAMCWGDRSYFGLGAGVAEAPFAIGGGHVFSTISLGRAMACGLEAGAVWCWGADRGTPSQDPALPVTTAYGESFTSLDVSYPSICALTAAGELHCGFRSWTTAPPAAAPFTYGGSRVMLASGCGLFADGSAFCHNDNSRAFPAGTFAALGDGSCGTGGDGVIRCWGSQDGGRLGDGVASGYAQSPVPVAPGLGLVKVSVSSVHGCGLTAAGAAWCWGTGRRGELGNGAGQYILTPVPVLNADGSVP